MRPERHTFYKSQVNTKGVATKKISERKVEEVVISVFMLLFEAKSKIMPQLFGTIHMCSKHFHQKVKSEIKSPKRLRKETSLLFDLIFFPTLKEVR